MVQIKGSVGTEGSEKFPREIPFAKREAGTAISGACESLKSWRLRVFL